MNSGFDSLSLALFTTLSPAGVIAFISMTLPLLFFSLTPERRTRLNHYLAFPYAIVLVGFIASATHLGTPSNALHVFSGIGRSPLSNEVLWAVIFLFVAGSYWMISFKENFPTTLARIWLGLACIAGIALIVMTSLAYSVDTVITWNSKFTPFNLWFSALLAGPVIGILCCVCAKLEAPRYYRALLFVSLGALVIGAIVLFLHGESLAFISNEEFSAISLVPSYPLMVVIHTLCGGIGIILASVSLKKGLSRRTEMSLLVFACLCLIVAIFLMRMAFYDLHMTAGF